MVKGVTGRPRGWGFKSLQGKVYVFMTPMGKDDNELGEREGGAEPREVRMEGVLFVLKNI